MAKLKGKAKAAFLRRMKKGRKKKHGGGKRKRKAVHTSHKRTKGHHVKKRKSRKGGKRRHHSGGLGKYLPDQHRLVGLGSAFAYGKVEAAASKDQAHFLNKVPSVVSQIGRAGNLGAILWLAGVVTKHAVVKDVASGVLHVAAYQNARGAAFTKDSADFKLGGPGRGRRDEQLVEEYLRRR